MKELLRETKEFRKIKKAQQNKTPLQKATRTLEAKHISQGPNKKRNSPDFREMRR